MTKEREFICKKRVAIITRTASRRGHGRRGHGRAHIIACDRSAGRVVPAVVVLHVLLGLTNFLLKVGMVVNILGQQRCEVVYHERVEGNMKFVVSENTKGVTT